MIKNKRKQEKTIKRLELIRDMYNKLLTLNYQQEREKLREGEVSELCNSLNEKLPHHIRLDLLE